MEGYKPGSNKPDPEWWLSQIRAGEEYRKTYTCEDKQEDFRSYYRGNFRPGIFPKNLFFTMKRTIVPRVYFRNPSISLVSRKPGAINIAIAKVLERIDNQLIRSMRVKNEMKNMADNVFDCGTSIGKLGFGAEFTPTPDPGGTSAPITSKGGRVEYRTGIADNMPWFKGLQTSAFVVEQGCRSIDETFFAAELIRRPFDDLKNDPRFPGISKMSAPEASKDEWGLHYGTEFSPRDIISLWEVRDKRTRDVFVIAPSLTDRVLIHGDDEFQIDGGLPYYTFSFNEDNQSIWGVPDAKILEPYQLEINEVKTRMMEHRRLSIVKILAEKGAISKEEADKMLEESPGAVINVANIHGIQMAEIAPIPDSLFKQEQAIMQDVREVMGFSRNAFGEFATGSADRTATEAQIVRQASEIRVDERRDKMADVLTEMIKGVHHIIFNHWSNQQVVDVVGPEGLPVWVEFSGKDLQGGKFTVSIDPDSSVPETKALREEKAIKMYNLLREDQMINPLELRKFLLRELKGVDFDNLLLDPNQPGASPQNPVSLEQFGDQIAQGGPNANV